MNARALEAQCCPSRMLFLFPTRWPLTFAGPNGHTDKQVGWGRGVGCLRAEWDAAKLPVLDASASNRSYWRWAWRKGTHGYGCAQKKTRMQTGKNVRKTTHSRYFRHEKYTRNKKRQEINMCNKNVKPAGRVNQSSVQLEGNLSSIEQFKKLKR